MKEKCSPFSIPVQIQGNHPGIQKSLVVTLITFSLLVTGSLTVSHFVCVITALNAKCFGREPTVKTPGWKSTWGRITPFKINLYAADVSL